MLKKLCGFLFLGALIVGCSCDIHCFIEKQMKSLPEDIFSGQVITNMDCSSIKESLNGVRNDVKSCSLTKINVDKFEAFTDQICLENGTLHKVALKYQDCFAINSGRTLECFVQSGIQVSIEVLEKPFELLKSICEKTGNIYNCINTQFLTHCGDEAGKLTQNFTSALSSYTNGLCEEINGSSLNQVVYINIFLGLLYVFLMWHKD